jgi:hypothetical protein
VENNREPLPLGEFQRMDFINYIDQLQRELKACEEKYQKLYDSNSQKIGELVSTRKRVGNLSAKVEQQELAISQLETAKSKKVVSLLQQLALHLEDFNGEDNEHY